MFQWAASALNNALRGAAGDEENATASAPAAPQVGKKRGRDSDSSGPKRQRVAEDPNQPAAKVAAKEKADTPQAAAKVARKPAPERMAIPKVFEQCRTSRNG